MKLDTGFATDAGPREGVNQDSVLVESRGTQAVLLVLADGMGGARAGEQASREAVTVIRDRLLGSAAGLPGEHDAADRLREAIQAANTSIYHKAQTSAEFHGMGCTVAAVLVLGDLFWVASVGDSRVYLVREAAGYQLTDDHTWVNARVREGVLTQEQAATHSLRHVLDRALGTQPVVEVDVRADEILEDGDALVLCSDGLYGVIDEMTLASVVTRFAAQQAADALLHLALEAPTHDNSSVIVARVHY
jgi:protein phosphatase